MASLIEQYLNKANLHTITFEDFKNFYRLKLDESQTLEYKSGELLVGYQRKYVRNGILDKEANKGFIKLATSIAGFANAIGGLFILGIKEIPVKRHSQIVRKRPGEIIPIPDDVMVAHCVKTEKPAQLRATFLLFQILFELSLPRCACVKIHFSRGLVIERLVWALLIVKLAHSESLPGGPRVAKYSRECRLLHTSRYATTSR